MYCCVIRAELNEVKTEKVILANNIEYFYTVNPVEITNSLGVDLATLVEYSIKHLNGQNYKLCKTKKATAMIFMKHKTAD